MLQIQNKWTQKQVEKDMNKMEWRKMDYLIFPAVRIRGHHNVPFKRQQEIN